VPALPVTFRPGRTRAVLLTAAVAIVVVITVVAFLLEQLGPGERLSFLLTALLLAGVLVLLSRPRITADDSGVTVVNITSRHRLEWAQIIQVNLRPGDAWVFLDLSDRAGHPAGHRPGTRRRRRAGPARARPGPLRRRPRAALRGTSGLSRGSRPCRIRPCLD